MLTIDVLTSNHERITNEAKALELVSQQTMIPVPKLLEYGEHADGRRYLVTEFIPGILLREFQHRGCSIAIGEKHTDNTPCETCLNQAYSNALQFIKNTVFPELAKLTSHQRGIDGFAMPPSWLSPDIGPGSLDSEAYFKRGNKLANAIAKFLPTEYIECYDKWRNKAELDILIESGDLPHPSQLM